MRPRATRRPAAARNATKHFRGTQHPIVESFEPGEDWRWCYADEVMLDEG